MKASEAWQRWTATSLVVRILAGLVIGLVLALIVPQWKFIGVLGFMFVGALKAIAPILVAVLVAASIAKAGEGLGARFRTVILCYLVSTFLAAPCAVLGSMLFPVSLELKTVADGTAPGGLSDVFHNLMTNLVANPVDSLARANYIGILFWAIVAGAALRWKASKATIENVEDWSRVITLIVQWVIQFAPLGILGLVFSSVSESGLEIFTTYGELLLLLLGVMFVSVFVLNPLMAFLMVRRNPYPLLLTCLKESGFHAFFTRSSSANIPINMSLCRRLGLDEDFYSVSIPLGSTINMNGAAVTITVMTLAVAHTVGIEVNLWSALLLSVVATLGACGTSGVAGGSILLVPMACSLFGISGDIAMQAVAIGFVIGVIQDSMETAINSSLDVFFTATAEHYDKKKKGKDM